jgi:hypothetical protein
VLFKFIYILLCLYVSVAIANALAPHIAQALANSGLDDNLRRLFEMLVNLLP